MHFARPAEVDERIERGADGTAGVEDVVDQHDDLVVDRLRELGRLDDRLRRDGGEVVAIEGDVEDAERHRRPFHRADLFRHPLADRNAAAADADDDQIVDSTVLFDDFDGHTPDRAVHARGVEEFFLDVHAAKAARRIAWRRLG